MIEQAVSNGPPVRLLLIEDDADVRISTEQALSLAVSRSTASPAPKARAPTSASVQRWPLSAMSVCLA